MSRTKKALATFAALTVLLASYGLYQFITKTPDAVPPSTPSSVGLEKSSLTKLGGDGKKLWTLQAKTVHSTPQETTADQIELVFFRDEKETLRVQAEHLIRNPKTDDLTLTGKIVATSSEFTLQTENLRWQSDEEKLWTDAPVRLEHPEMILAGTGFEYSPKTGVATIKKDAHLIWKKQQQSKEPGK